jgi:hypothetical protein
MARWFGIALLPLAGAGQAAVDAYTHPLIFLSALADQGLAVQQEGFEDDAVWGDVRSTIVGGFQAAPAVLSQGIRWTSNFAGGDITTGDGAARRGSWGFYAYPHGQFGTGADCSLPGVCGDGFVGEAAQGLLAIGGWVRTNTPPADLNLFIDGMRLDFGDAGILDTGYAFFGAISSTPFQRFEFREMEGAGDEAKFIFADDFSFALAPVPEPGAASLLLLGLGVGWAAGRRRVHSRT